MKASAMESEKNFQATVPPLLLAQVQAAAEAEHISLDDLAVKALQNHIARRTLQRFSREAETRRGGMTDQQVESYVDQVIHEHRDEQRKHER